MLIVLKLVTVKLIAVNVVKKRQLHTSSFAEIILFSKKFCIVNLMIFCQSSKVYQMLKSWKYFYMGTTWNLRSLTAETYHLLLLCKSMFYQPKGSQIRIVSMVSWCFQVRSSPDISFFFLFFLSSHSYHIIVELLCVFFTPIQWYFFLLIWYCSFKNKIRERTLHKQYLFHVPSFLAIEWLNIKVNVEMPLYLCAHDQIKYSKIKKKSLIFQRSTPSHQIFLQNILLPLR